MTKRMLFLLVLSLLIPAAFAQSRWPAPNGIFREGQIIDRCSGSSVASVHIVENYKIELVPVDDEKSGMGQGCSAYLVKPGGVKLLLLQEPTVSILKGTGKDVFGNGNPGLVLEGFSGGAHCCFTYVFADLGDSPTILPEIENQTGFYIFRDASDGKYKILTGDGEFDYFDNLCHACSTMPTVVLGIEGGRLRDMSPQFVAGYDEEIAQAKARINHDDLAKFMAEPADSEAESDEMQNVRVAVLKIVFAYLYSGRETMAWQTLDQMWPASDRQRIKELILKTRSEGLLSEIGVATSGRKPTSNP